MEFVIPDMNCGGCAKAVANALKRLDPAALVDIDVAVKIARVSSALPEPRLIAAIEAAGFHPARQS
ncbi:heavy-metal-associated domain-containing protein [Paraburkholderia sp. MMS20-SJTR3]|uniref:Heavy-metal-associated domain-containing protein n=1 Tax=Paraburkholderia sejongensis TaxID=2886946 RepID=A0ABS8JY81_9BURK|nr:heavy-metal-associated domain-containing protein [Paraburkholderia sp. MMS20-SJTR3]MCC8394865.1 heavy-metal-associated domain-containing protein [Paraburkholderia sp. MMS20-SJTR3]